jgi:RimJ/RimL family protein N-acetyltransferase
MWHPLAMFEKMEKPRALGVVDFRAMATREPLDAALLAFRPLEKADLGRLASWFNAPHARRWFGHGRSLGSVVEEYAPYIEGTTPIHPFLVSYEARPIGMIAWERFGDSPDFMRTYGVEDPDAVNCDVIIGEVDFAGRGLGAPLLRRFLSEIVFFDSRHSKCIIDPEVENLAAIRAYEKAGFCYLRTLLDDGEGNAIHLMELRREELMPAGEIR